MDGNRDNGLPENVTPENLPEWCLAAEEGNAPAQYQAAAYFLEHPCPGSRETAERYLCLAAEQNHPLAGLALARLELEAGRLERAAELLQEAADNGSLDAIALLAECYAKGQGVDQDLHKAEELFTAWAREGAGEDKLALALRYKNGDLVPQNLGLALSWVRRAELTGLTDALARFQATSRQEPPQPAVQEKEVSDAPQSPAGGSSGPEDPEEQYKLGQRYRYGDGVEKDLEQAAYWYRKAAEQGNAKAQFSLGVCYRYGYGVEKDSEQAVYWYRKAAEQGSEAAKAALKRMGYR